MKMHQMNVRRNSGQTGFTLIELIVVIVILGILAATALPKFAGLGADARLASLNAAKGSLRGVIQMAHAQYLANTSGIPLLGYTSEGTTSTYLTGVYYLGYPTAVEGTTAIPSYIVNMAGLTSADYSIVIGPVAANGTTAPTMYQPFLTANEVAIIPNSVAGTPAGKTCYIKYTQPIGIPSAGTAGSTLGVVSDVPSFIVTAGNADGTNPC